MNIVITFAPHTRRWFEEVAIGACKALQELGNKCNVVSVEKIDALNDDPYDVVLVLAPHGYVEINSVNFTKHTDKVYAMWEMEQIPHIDATCARMETNWAACQRYINFYDVIVTESDCKTKFLQSKGYDAHTIPVGYHPHFCKDLAQIEKKKWDVFFVGALFPRRQAIISALVKKGYKYFNPPDPRNFFDPIEKARAIAQSKVCLNIHHNEVNAFEKPRLIVDYMANGGFVVTEKIDHPERFEHGKHWVMADYKDLVEATAKWIEAPQKARDEIAQEAQGYISREYTMSTFMRWFTDIARTKLNSKIKLTREGAPPIRYFTFTRPEIQSMVDEDVKLLLDIGCGKGGFGGALKEKNPKIKVHGIELDTVAGKDAEAVLDEVWVGDVEAMDLAAREHRYDVVTCNDVLEHLREPWALVDKVKQVLKPNGYLLASVPNVQHIDIVEDLLKGKWNYVPAGILDRTHLRFFTERSIFELFESAGFRIEQMRKIKDAQRVLPGWAKDENFLVIQYVIKATIK